MDRVPLTYEEKLERGERAAETKMYAQMGLELACTFRLAKKIEDRRDKAVFEQEAAALRRSSRALVEGACRKCGLIFRNRGELRRHKQIKHHGPNAAPYQGKLVNSVWTRQETGFE